MTCAEQKLLQTNSCFPQTTEGMAEKRDVQKDSFAWYCDSWIIANRIRLKASSSARYKADMENHIKPFFGERMLSEITPEDVSEKVIGKNCPEYSGIVSYNLSICGKAERTAAFQA